MKTITMYELLGMVKDGKASDITTNFMFDRKKYNLLAFLDAYTLDINSLNWEIEIIEEEKKAPTLNNIRESYGLPGIEEKKIPEKLEDYCLDKKGEYPIELTLYEQILKNKTNEIIDYLYFLKSKGE